MANSSNEDPIQLLKRFGAYLTLKISNLFSISFDNLNSRSVGTVAGLAIAMVLTWRLLRTPTANNQRRRPKRTVANTASSSSSTGANASAVATSSTSSAVEDSRVQNVVDEFFQPVKPTLAQVVRQKLCDGRKVTCRLLGVILEESTPEEIQKQATVRSSVLEVLLEITKFCDLYLMDRILDDESG
ncbi:peroxisome biogenesis protein 22-like, partial [Thalictrum thalictroides]